MKVLGIRVTVNAIRFEWINEEKLVEFTWSILIDALDASHIDRVGTLRHIHNGASGILDKVVKYTKLAKIMIVIGEAYGDESIYSGVILSLVFDKFPQSHVMFGRVFDAMNSDIYKETMATKEDE